MIKMWNLANHSFQSGLCVCDLRWIYLPLSPAAVVCLVVVVVVVMMVGGLVLLEAICLSIIMQGADGVL